jgi:hypothetical protein
VFFDNALSGFNSKADAGEGDVQDLRIRLWVVGWMF